MITFGRKSSPYAPEGGERKQRPSTNTESSVGNSSVSRRTGATRGQYVSTSAMGGSGAASGATQIGTVPLDIDINPIMDGMTYQTDERQLFEVYRDIYFHDPICGATVDMFSNLPFSNYSFGGGKEALLEPYYEVNERLNLAASFPNIATDQMVTGAFAGSMIYNKEKKRFVDLMCHRYDNLDVIPVPLNSQDPILKLNPPQHLIELLGMESKRVDKIKEALGPTFVEGLLSGNPVELDPIGTIYIPRRAFSFGEGVSLYKRVLPLWLIEKNLYRGTLVESGRRQRGILQLQCGDGDQWDPTPEEMEFITDLFMNADADPIGSIVTTKLGVQVNEFRQGGDFWKITDIWDQTGQYKLRAMGVSESFLSGEATLANTEANLSVFIEYMRSYRDRLTRDTFYNKIFPLISLMEGLVVTRNGKVVRRSGLMDGGLDEVMYRLNDVSKLFIPSVHWEKQLRPEQDQGMLDTLRAMSELGLPVSMRAIAAAGGYNLNQLLMDQDENLALQRRLLDYKKRQMELESEFIPPADGGGGGGFGSMSSAVLGTRPRPNLLSRNYGEASEVYDLTPTGKKKLIIDQRAANERIDRRIAKTAAELSRDSNRSLFGVQKTPYAPTSREHRGLGRLGI